MSPILQGLANGSVRGYGGYLPLGPSTAFESIASATGTGSSNTITFSSIPSTYQHLQVRGLVKTTDTASNGYGLLITFNGVGGTSYAWHSLYGLNSAVSVESGANQSYIYCTYPVADNFTGRTNILGAVLVDIHDYASTSKNKTLRAFTGLEDNTSANSNVTLQSGLFNNTSAITSVTFSLLGSRNFTTTTQFALYGIKGA